MGLASLVAVCIPAQICETEVFYTKLYSALDQCTTRATLFVLGDLNATTATDRVGYDLCAGPHGFGTRNINRSC